MRIAIVRSMWHADITARLLEGSLNALARLGVGENRLKIIEVPGSYELPIGAQIMLEECDPLPSAVICLGCVIRGETSHFDYICQAVAGGISQVALKYNLPVVFGVLTDDNIEQSMARSGGTMGNKGEEAALTAVKMSLLHRKLRR